MSDNLAEPTFDTESARRVLENEKQDRAARVSRELEELLDKNRCGIVISVTYANNQPQPVFAMQVIALD